MEMKLCPVCQNEFEQITMMEKLYCSGKCRKAVYAAISHGLHHKYRASHNIRKSILSYLNDGTNHFGKLCYDRLIKCFGIEEINRITTD